MTLAPRQGEPRPEQGHGQAPHTADCIIEAWGPDRASCLTEALLALVEVFADVGDTAAVDVLPLSSGPASDRDLLVSLLEEVIFVVGVFGVVPMRFHLAETEDGALAGDMEVVPAGAVEQVGPVPKAVSYHGLEIGEKGGEWRCRVVVDV